MDMDKLPHYIGPCAFGIKLGVITPNCDLIGMVYQAMEECDSDSLLDDGDVICITESVVARAQNNYVTTDEIAKNLQEQYGITKNSRLGVLFPITSRNRFAIILRGLARAVPEGEVILQLSFPCDEVGNQIIDEETAYNCLENEIIRFETVAEECFHPITKVNYPRYYQEIIEAEGAKAQVYLCNDPHMITSFNPDCVIISNIHDRHKTCAVLQGKGVNCITLQDICSDSSKPSWSEWGLLGSNMSTENLLNLAPKEGDEYATRMQQKIHNGLGKKVEVLIYGDGAYKDPPSGIYELADPQPGLGSTEGFKGGRMREGVKYKLLADTAHAEGKSVTEIEETLKAHQARDYGQDEMVSEGTTPRKMEDLIASLADLISGSADAGTPVVLVKGFFNKR